jgi:hypothetical protein
LDPVTKNAVTTGRRATRAFIDDAKALIDDERELPIDDEKDLLDFSAKSFC